MFKFLKKKEEHHNTYDGRFITDDEIFEMIHKDKKSPIDEDLKEVSERFVELKNMIDKYNG